MRGTVCGVVGNNMPSLNQVCNYGYDAKQRLDFSVSVSVSPPPLVRVAPSLPRWRGVVRCLSAVISANTPLLSPLATAPLRASSSTRSACSTSACLSPLRLDSCVLSPSDRRLPPPLSFAPLSPATRHCSFSTPSSSHPPPRRSTPACSSTPLFLALFDRSRRFSASAASAAPPSPPPARHAAAAPSSFLRPPSSFLLPPSSVLLPPSSFLLPPPSRRSFLPPSSAALNLSLVAGDRSGSTAAGSKVFPCLDVGSRPSSLRPVDVGSRPSSLGPSSLGPSSLRPVDVGSRPSSLGPSSLGPSSLGPSSLRPVDVGSRPSSLRLSSLRLSSLLPPSRRRRPVSRLTTLVSSASLASCLRSFSFLCS